MLCRNQNKKPLLFSSPFDNPCEVHIVVFSTPHNVLVFKRPVHLETRKGEPSLCGNCPDQLLQHISTNPERPRTQRRICSPPCKWEVYLVKKAKFRRNTGAELVCGAEKFVVIAPQPFTNCVQREHLFLVQCEHDLRRKDQRSSFNHVHCSLYEEKNTTLTQETALCESNYSVL